MKFKFLNIFLPKVFHKKKIEDAIRDGVHNIVADESIIGQDGKKKIKIPVRGIKE